MRNPRLAACACVPWGWARCRIRPRTAAESETERMQEELEELDTEINSIVAELMEDMTPEEKAAFQGVTEGQ